MAGFFVGVVVGVLVGWIMPAPDFVRDRIDRILDKFGAK